MSREELNAFMHRVFPQVATEFNVEHVDANQISVRMHVNDKHLRPGETVSGPSMFSLADVSVYLLVLSMIGPEALAVTTSCSIDFMRKPAAGADLLSTAKLLKLGRVLAVGDVLIHSEGFPHPVARASLTYSIPPKSVGVK